jgi:hypothetical protein
MAPDASDALGAQQIAGTWVNPRGMAKKFVAQVAGSEFGGAAGRMAVRRATGDPNAGLVGSPDFGRDAYVAVSEREVVLVKTKQGLMKLKLTDEAIAREPRSEVASVELGDGKIACPLTISFSDGARWELDVPRAGKKAAKGVVAALTDPA